MGCCISIIVAVLQSNLIDRLPAQTYNFLILWTNRMLISNYCIDYKN